MTALAAIFVLLVLAVGTWIGGGAPASGSASGGLGTAADLAGAANGRVALGKTQTTKARSGSGTTSPGATRTASPGATGRGSGSKGSGRNGTGPSSAGGSGSGSSGGSPSGGSPGGAPAGTPQQIAASMLSYYGWPQSEFGCLNLLWIRESGWNVYATNPSSGAYGIPQSLPAWKLASAGADWRTDPATQIRWGLSYIKSVYGTPCGAWAHETAYSWY